MWSTIVWSQTECNDLEVQLNEMGRWRWDVVNVKNELMRGETGWRYYEGDTTCECGLATENTAHMMQCTLLEQPCSLDDLNKFNDTAKKCVERWKTLV